VGNSECDESDSHCDYVDSDGKICTQNKGQWPDGCDIDKECEPKPDCGKTSFCNEENPKWSAQKCAWIRDMFADAMLETCAIAVCLFLGTALLGVDLGSGAKSNKHHKSLVAHMKSLSRNLRQSWSGKNNGQK